MSTLSVVASAPSQLASGESQVWSWTFPGAPICINLSRALIGRLQAEVDARTRVHAPREGIRPEIGGLLFGHQRGNGPVVEIEDYSWIPSELPQDGTYSLSKAELDRLRGERAGSASVVVGYFRTDSGDNLELRDAELDLMAKQFADASNVALLICSSKPHTGGFFFWMGEGVISPFSLMDFPLDVARLKFHDDPDVAGSPSETHASASVPPPVAVSLPLPLPVSAPPPPAAPMKDADPHLLPWPVLDRPPVKSAAVLRPQPLEELPVQQTAPVTLADPVKVPLADVREAPVVVKEAAEKDAGVQEADLKRSALQKATQATPVRSPSVWFSILWALTLLFALSAIAGIIIVFNGGTLPLVGPAHAAKATPGPRFPLQLNVEAQGTGLNIRWDAQSAPVTDAREGRLTITEANKPLEVISLTAEQLATGHIYFQSPAEHLEIQLETTSNTGRLTRESVLALSSTPHTDVAARSAGSPAQIGSPAQAIAGQPKPALRSFAASPTASAPAPMPVRKVETIQIPSKSVDAGSPQISELPAESRLLVARSPRRLRTGRCRASPLSINRLSPRRSNRRTFLCPEMLC